MLEDLICYRLKDVLLASVIAMVGTLYVWAALVKVKDNSDNMTIYLFVYTFPHTINELWATHNRWSLTQ